jgi:hypothetical protein
MAPLPQDEGFTRMALAEAAKWDFPFGAVIVREPVSGREVIPRFVTTGDLMATVIDRQV